MIHPFAHFSAAPVPGETLWERAALLERPAADFAEFLKAGKSATPAAPDGIAQPQQAAAHVAEPRVASLSARSRDPQPPASGPQESMAAGSATPGSAEAAPNPDASGETGSQSENGTETPDTPRGGAPRFADVPDSAKYPAGPYRQAPPEYGGEWWSVSPFTGEQPWLNQEMAVTTSSISPSRYAAENLPKDFLAAFGEMPLHRAGESGSDFVARVSRWKQDLEFFQQTGLPEGFDEAQVELASADYEQWGMGRPVFYEGRYGWFARFPDSSIPEFEMDAASAVEAPQLAIARFQVRLLRQGLEPAHAHPYVPPHLLAQEA